jgi:hypothetical protein
LGGKGVVDLGPEQGELRIDREVGDQRGRGVDAEVARAAEEIGADPPIDEIAPDLRAVGPTVVERPGQRPQLELGGEEVGGESGAPELGLIGGLVGLPVAIGRPHGEDDPEGIAVPEVHQAAVVEDPLRPARVAGVGELACAGLRQVEAVARNTGCDRCPRFVEEEATVGIDDPVVLVRHDPAAQVFPEPLSFTADILGVPPYPEAPDPCRRGGEVGGRERVELAILGDHREVAAIEVEPRRAQPRQPLVVALGRKGEVAGPSDRPCLLECGHGRVSTHGGELAEGGGGDVILAVATGKAPSDQDEVGGHHPQ